MSFFFKGYSHHLSVYRVSEWALVLIQIKRVVFPLDQSSLMTPLPVSWSGGGREEPDGLQAEHHEPLRRREALPWRAGDRPLQGAHCVTLFAPLSLHNHRFILLS